MSLSSQRSATIIADGRPRNVASVSARYHCCHCGQFLPHTKTDEWVWCPACDGPNFIPAVTILKGRRAER